MSKLPITYFGAGPARLPKPVLEAASRAMLDYEGTGLSILEIPHRGPHFKAILEETNALVRELAEIGDDYEVLWLQGGGRLQFAMIPENFLNAKNVGSYIDSGHWSREAYETAKLCGLAEVVASSQEEGYMRLPDWPNFIFPDTSYVHITTNNTIYGTQWRDIPPTLFRLVGDMSSDIFGIDRHYDHFDLFYAVAQKNMGPAGCTLVCIRKEFLAEAADGLPGYHSYKAQAKEPSLLNTAPVAAIYVTLLTLRLLKEKGLENQIRENEEKAALLYATLEQSRAFYLPVAPSSRSIMNVIFRPTDPGDQSGFERHCALLGIEGIVGHRSVGGFRASLYNAVTLDDVHTLCEAIESYIPAGA